MDSYQIEFYSCQTLSQSLKSVKPICIRNTIKLSYETLLSIVCE